jgi:electron transfer flavoprotein beta subunit
MRVIVCIKQIGFIYHPIAIDSTNGDVDPEKMVYILNPYDEVAMEEAMRIKERFVGSEIIVITAGLPRTEEALRYAFAFGADKMIRIDCQNLDPWATSSVLAETIKGLNYDIILCGKKAIDTNDNQVGTFVAELLDITQVSGIVRLDVVPESKKAIVERYLGKGDREAIECDLPALFTVEKSMNDPRYPKLPDRLRAEKQEIEIVETTSFSTHFDVKLNLSESASLTPPRPRPKKVFTPDSHLSANERRRLIMLGGIADKKGDVLQGAPEDIAKKIVSILIEEKFI